MKDRLLFRAHIETAIAPEENSKGGERDHMPVTLVVTGEG